MTNREIKLELAKIALVQKLSMDSIKQMYEWIIEENSEDNVSATCEDEKTDYDKIPIKEIVNQIALDEPDTSRYPSNISEVFLRNDINTVGDLLNVGRRMFKRYRNIGSGSITRIDGALYDLYAITSKDW